METLPDHRQSQHEAPTERRRDRRTAQESATGNPAPEPVVVRPDEPDVLSLQLQNRLIWAFIALGVAVRLVRFALRFPLWNDEALLSANLVDRGYLELTQPLDYQQVCPVVFLWIQLALTRLFGFTEYSLRLFPFACSIGSIFLFRYLAARLVRGTALVLAVAIFAVAYPLIRYSAEAKPYGVDMFVGLVFFALAVTWWQHREQTRWLWIAAVLSPLLLAVSYPAIFVFGGVSITVAGVLWADRPRRGWLAWSTMNLLGLATFAAVFFLSMRVQNGTELGFMRDYWEHAFPPPLTEPLALLWWLAKAHTGEMVAYPIGDANFGSTATFVCCAAGAVLFWRRRHWPTLMLLVAPLAAALVAAALHRYPYGWEFRFQIYSASMFCIFAGLGLAALIRLDPKRRDRQPAATIVMLLLISLVGFGSLGRDIFKPYKSIEEARLRDFARWFWFNAEHDGEVLCLKSDLQKEFAPGLYSWGLSSMYLCNQRIYSPRHHRGESRSLEQVDPAATLRCVQYCSPEKPYDKQALGRWLDRMHTRYRLVSTEKLPLLTYDRTGKNLLTSDYLEVYKFVPRDRPTEQGSLQAIRSTTPSEQQLSSRPADARARRK